MNRKAGKSFAKVFTAFAAFAMAFLVCLSFLNENIVNADSEVIISAEARRSDVGPGDLLIIDVVANRFPGITSFGPIEFNFDSDKAEFVSFESGSELSSFLFTETQTDGVLSVTGVDQFAGVSSDGSGDDVAVASYESNYKVTLFSISIRMRPESSGDINCWISSTGEFLSPTESITARIGSGVTLPIKRAGLSSDATIAILRVRGTSITPEFNPNITEYSCSVELSVTEVQINVTPTNLWAAVVIDGTQHLNVGDNIVSIDVTAQDGVTHMRYTIHVERKESNIPDDASMVDANGNTYTFLDTPEDITIPEGFVLTTRTINGYSVPAFVKDGVSSVLLYLFDGTQSPGFYFYNINTKTVIKYEPEITLIESSQVLKVTEIPAEIVVPDEFKPAIYDTGTQKFNGFVNQEGDFICYMSDENGNADFYYISQIDGSISLYRFADKKAEILYSYMFDVLLVIAIIEAVIITITVYILRRMVSDRTNPRPKRV